MTTPLLRLDEVSRRYGAVTALHPLSLDIPAGARHAIIGPNGAGKSTVLHLVAGSIGVSGGQVLFDQQPITRLRAARRADRGIGRTWQHPAVVDQLSVADNVAVAVRRRAHRAARIAAALEQVGLAGDAATVAGQLSYGQRRLLEIAVVLAAGPRLMLLDEPSAGLDPAEIQRLTAIIRALPGGATIVLVDHHLPLVFELADTITVLAGGRHVATGSSDQIRADPQVRDAYFADATGPVTARRTRAGALDTVLAVENLRAGYHGAPILDQIDLTVAAGTVHALLGRNGAGKSTLINVLAGLHTAHPCTRIRLHGVEMRPGGAVRRGVALVPQGRRLWASLTVDEHLRIAAAVGHRHCDGRRWSVTDVVDLLPALRDKLRRYPAQMSGGEQQMLAVARALLLHPRLLLLDEPSEGLAPQVVEQLAAVITAIADTGVAVLLAEQNQRFARTVADQISVLGAGRVALTTTEIDDSGVWARIADLLGVVTAGSPV